MCHRRSSCSSSQEEGKGIKVKRKKKQQKGAMYSQSVFQEQMRPKGDQTSSEVKALLKKTPANEKPIPGTPLAPVAASHCSESEDPVQNLTPLQQRSPSPGGSENPKQESEAEPCTPGHQQNPHTGGVAPQPEVCLSGLLSERHSELQSAEQRPVC